MYAAIDIGSNTVLLLIAGYSNGSLEVLHEEQRMPRLGKGVDKSGNLHPDSVEQALKVLKDFNKRIVTDFPEVRETFATATSAVRDAADRQQFLNQIEKHTGFQVQVLSGEEEAEFTFAGALGMLDGIEDGNVIDIGGGSTEIIFGKNGKPADSFSYNMGSVRFTERFLQGDPPARREIEACRKGIRETLQQRDIIFDKHFDAEALSAIGVAGTVTSLAFMDLGLEAYEPSLINGHAMGFNSIKTWINRIALMSVSELKTAFPRVMEGRADVFLAGLLILQTFMEYYNLHKLIVSTGGIRHGAILTKANP